MAKTIPNRIKCFASYSRRDSGFVNPIISLMRSSGTDIFQDHSSIEAGEEWYSVIIDNLNEAQIVFVFWSRHASRSVFVRKEINIALKNEQTIIPVLLDNTKLLKSIARFQWIDFRRQVPLSARLTELPKQASALRIAVGVTSFCLTAVVYLTLTWTLVGVACSGAILSLAITANWLVWKFTREFYKGDTHIDHDRFYRYSESFDIPNQYRRIPTTHPRSPLEYARKLDKKVRDIVPI